MPTCRDILVVEDEESIRESLRMVLEMSGYQVTTAANGREALDLLPKMPCPCLILLDLMMPVMDGWTFKSELEKDAAKPAVPVVLVTAFAGGPTPPPKADGILRKPVDLDSLLRVVQQYCGEAAP